MKRLLVTIAILVAFAAPLYAQTDVSTSGTFTANLQELVLDLNGHGTTSIQLTGTWAATVQFSATVNGTDFFPIPNVLRYSTQTVINASTTVNDTYVIASASFQKVKVHTTAFTSGTVGVAMVGSPPVSFPSAISGGAASNVTVVNPSLAITAASLPLPTGAATEATLASIDGKFPAAAPLADGTPNPTLTGIQTFQMVWDPFTTNQWNRWDGAVRQGVGDQSSRWFVALTDAFNQEAVIQDGEPGSTNFGLTVRQVGLPNAAPAADNTANPDLTKIQTFVMKWVPGDSNWDRWDGGVNATTVDPRYVATFTLDVVGERATVSTATNNWTNAIFRMQTSGFVGSTVPVISFDNGATWNNWRAFKMTTVGGAGGELVTGLSGNDNNGFFVFPWVAGITDFGFELDSHSAGSLGVNVSSNTANNLTHAFIDDGGGSITIDSTVLDEIFLQVEITNNVLTDRFPASAFPVDNTSLLAGMSKIWNFNAVWDSSGVNWDRMVQPLTDAQLRAAPVPISAASLPLPTGAATAALQTQPGVDIGDVTVNNGAGVNAVNVQDGGNSLTVDSVNFDIRDLAFATDKVDVSGSAVINGSVIATATLVALDSAITVNTEGYGTVGFQSEGAGGTGGIFRFEATTNGTDWVDAALSMLQDGGAFNPQQFQDSVVTTGTTYIWRGSVAGYTQFRVRYDGGAGSQNVTLYRMAAPADPVNEFAIRDQDSSTSADVMASVPSSVSSGLIVRQVGLPAGGLLGDGLVNMTLTKIATFPFVWDNSGAVWNRWTGAVSLTGTLPAFTVTPTFNVGTFPDNEPFNIAQYGGSNVGAGNPFFVKDQRAATPTTTTVAASATSVTCVALNANRLGASIYNDSTADLYVKLGATASTTSFIAKVFTDGLFTVPFNYTGVVDCIWSSATGNARVTEVIQ